MPKSCQGHASVVSFSLGFCARRHRKFTFLCLAFEQARFSCFIAQKRSDFAHKRSERCFCFGLTLALIGIATLQGTASFCVFWLGQFWSFRAQGMQSQIHPESHRVCETNVPIAQSRAARQRKNQVHQFSGTSRSIWSGITHIPIGHPCPSGLGSPHILIGRPLSIWSGIPHVPIGHPCLSGLRLYTSQLDIHVHLVWYPHISSFNTYIYVY
jgi:hypothetical protein